MVISYVVLVLFLSQCDVCSDNGNDNDNDDDNNTNNTTNNKYIRIITPKSKISNAKVAA